MLCAVGCRVCDGVCACKKSLCDVCVLFCVMLHGLDLLCCLCVVVVYKMFVCCLWLCVLLLYGVYFACDALCDCALCCNMCAVVIRCVVVWIVFCVFAFAPPLCVLCLNVFVCCLWRNV